MLCALCASIVLVEPVAASVPVPSETVSVVVSGDLLVHKPLYSAASTAHGYDFRAQLRALGPLLDGDVNLCHAETPLYPGTPRSYPSFSTPVALADALAATGFDGCSTASNHSLDRGGPGVRTTLESLWAAGLVTAGTRAVAPVPGAPDLAVGWYEPRPGTKVAHLAYTYGTNGIKARHAWLVNRIKTKEIIADAKRARRDGADLVLVSLHWGTEYSPTPNAMQRELARTLTSSPAVDAIIGHHAHVVQSATSLNGKPVLYGVGNLWSAQGPWSGRPDSQFGAVVKLHFTRSGSGTFSFSGGEAQAVVTVSDTWSAVPATATSPRWRSVSRRAGSVLTQRLGSLVTVKTR